MSDAALRIPEAAQRLRCTRQTIYALHHRGTITIRKIGGRSFVLESEIDRALNEAPALAPSIAVPRQAA